MTEQQTEDFWQNYQDFAPIDFPKRSLTNTSVAGYRVFKTPDDFVTVEAETAAEAIQKSAISRPHKIEKIGFSGRALYGQNEMKGVQAPSENTADQPSETE